MQPLNAADRRVGFVVTGELLEPFVLNRVARAFGDFSQRQIAFSKEFSGAFKERHGRNGR